MKPLLTLLLVLWAVPVSAVTLYAKAAGGDWAAAATWSTTGSGGMDNSGPPALTDDVVFEAGSGPVTINAVSAEALTVSMTAGTGDYAGTLTCTDQWTLALAKQTTGVVWQASAAATLAFGDCIISMANGAAAATVTFAGAGKTYGALEILEINSTTLAITGANTFTTVTVLVVFATGSTTVRLDAGATTTVGDLKILNIGTIPPLGVLLSSATPGMPTTITKPNGVVNTADLIVTDITATGGATWCAYHATADGGGNTGWSFTACPYEPALQMTGVGR